MKENSLGHKISTPFLLKFAFPTIIVMIFSTLYGMVDGAFVSRLIGTDALSSVNIVMPIITIATSIGMMFATGGSAISGKLIGQSKDEKARQVFSLMTLSTFILGIILAGLCLVFINPLLKLLGVTDSIYRYCYDYTFYIVLFLPISITSMIFQIFFITAGKSTLGMIINIISGSVNIILDYVFIKIFKLGVTGSAIATSLGFAVITVFGFLYFSINKNNIIYLTKPVFDKKALTDGCKNGASEMVSNLSQSITLILYNNIIIRLAGVDGVASITILLYILQLIVAIFMGYSTGVSPLISYNYGKDNHSELKKIYKTSLIFILSFSVLVFILGQIFIGNLVTFFSDSNENVYNMAVDGYKIFGFGFLFMGFSIFGSAMFTALTNGKISAIISLLRTFVFIVITAIILPMIFGLNGVWLSFAVSEFLGMLVTTCYFKKSKSQYHYA